MKKRSTPQRICVGCQELRNKSDLLRVVFTPEGEIAFDETGKRSGRGAYLCRNLACLEEAYKAKRLERSLKHSVEPSVYDRLREELSDEKTEN